jgi:hypothetical protein
MIEQRNWAYSLLKKESCLKLSQESLVDKQAKPVLYENAEKVHLWLWQIRKIHW